MNETENIWYLKKNQQQKKKQQMLIIEEDLNPIYVMQERINIILRFKITFL